ncbi:ferritin-like domain-containing protein [Proteinivorax tanatarense]|uniref:Ferritin-like domain-containing protein n=1 Tax=Proteinivorax tanatarense TaxID=1260629 RepID=A0AAU7VK05_9FIRM
MSNYQEPIEQLDEKTKNISKAITSLKEEVEAVDYYNQRVATTNDPDLKKIFEHNRDEEIEHAVMTIEWLRRNMGVWDEELKETLFKEGPIMGHHGEEGEDSGGLSIGDMKK